MDTIFALASSEGKAGVAVIRLSGPGSWDAVGYLSGTLPPPRLAKLRRLTASDGTYLDSALVLCFEEGASFTDEQSAELHLHGSIAIVSAVLAELARVPGLRLAEPGEFTRRAMMNGRLDLSQVEALADLIESETELQRRQALALHDGALGDQVALWRKDLIRAAALLEATIDFADEDVPEDVSDEVRELLTKIDGALEREIDGSFLAERIRNGFEVAIIGAPNVGKSSLLNYIAGREAAIISSVAGTTRDVIEVRMDLAGVPVLFLDTAGLRDTDDVVEAMGVARARQRAERADLRLVLLGPEDDAFAAVQPGDIVRRTKSDLTNDARGISTVTGFGIAVLVDEIRNRLSVLTKRAGLASRQRHRTALEEGRAAIATALEMLDLGVDQYDITSEEVRVAIRALSSIVGDVDVENILDEVFSSFCLGK